MPVRRCERDGLFQCMDGGVPVVLPFLDGCNFPPNLRRRSCAVRREERETGLEMDEPILQPLARLRCTTSEIEKGMIIIG